MHHSLRYPGRRDLLLRLQHRGGLENIIEKMHMTSTLTKWYEEKGRHEIFAGNKAVPLAQKDHNLVLVDEHVRAERQHDLDDKGIAKTAREEKTRARDEALKQKIENDKMARLYREHVLGEKKIEGFVPLDGLLSSTVKPAPVAPVPVEKQQEVGAMGD